MSILLTCMLLFFNIGIILLMFPYGGERRVSIKLLIVFLVFGLPVVYMVIKWMLEYFVFRKIKVIYRIISDSKYSGVRKKMGVYDNMSLADVNEDVENWISKQDDKLNYLTKLEDYRRNFVGNISHELKTPLFTIQGYVHTLLDGGIYDEAINVKYLERAAVNLERLKNIVDDLEVINKLELGKINLRKETFEITAFCRDILDDLKLSAKGKKVKIGFKNADQKVFHVNADQEGMRRVIGNLLSNAIKYNKKQGEVFVSFYDLDEKVLVEVEDNGPGIEQEHLPHLFDRFYRIDHSGSRKEGGSGLGLAIVKHIVEAHGQTIQVRSTLGEGSTFTFSLEKAR